MSSRLQPAPWRRTIAGALTTPAPRPVRRVLTQAADLEEAPAWWVRPLDQLRADESDGGAAAKERSDYGEGVHSSFRLSGCLSGSEQWLAKEPGVSDMPSF